MTNFSEPTLYDNVPYPGGVFPSTHLKHLATIAALHGLKPADIFRSRVLELGCGFGANILPMAYHYPDGMFVGVDLSKSSVMRGRENVAALGLRNIELHNLDILNIEPDFGQFDYIISHGVYSWVPDIVRDKMLRIFRGNLAPHGVCYVSYNAYPFSHARDLARDLALFHTRHVVDPREKVAQARAILGFVSNAAGSETVHGQILHEQNDRISKMSDEFFYHDDLNETAQAFLLHQVVERAEQYGLQYLSDADFARGSLERYPANVRAVLQAFPDDEVVARNQYQDFIDGFGFRRTLFCHKNIELQRAPSLELFRQCYFTSARLLIDRQRDIKATDELSAGARSRIEFDVPGSIAEAVYLCVSKAYPHSVSFTELLTTLSSGVETNASTCDLQVDGSTLIDILYKLTCNDVIAFSLYPLESPIVESGKLLASSLARKQCEMGMTVVNFLHHSVRLENDHACYLLRLLDGTRGIDQLVEEVHKHVLESSANDEEKNRHQNVDVTRASVRAFLQQTRSLGLLAAESCDQPKAISQE